MLENTKGAIKKGQSRETGNIGYTRHIESNTEGVGDFPVLHFLPVYDFISHFYQLFLVSCLYVNSTSCKQYELFPLHVNQNSSSVFLCIA